MRHFRLDSLFGEIQSEHTRMLLELLQRFQSGQGVLLVCAEQRLVLQRYRAKICAVRRFSLPGFVSVKFMGSRYAD